MGTSAFDEFVEQYHRALDEFFRGNSEPAEALYSRREDATLANPFGPVVMGWAQIAQTTARASHAFTRPLISMRMAHGWRLEKDQAGGRHVLHGQSGEAWGT